MEKNKYCEVARDLARVICDIMNLFYKKGGAGAFKLELILSIRDIKFNGKKWTLE